MTEAVPGLAVLAAFSARIGADRRLVQGAGGNTSLKRGDAELWVKASGKWLAAAEREDVFVGMDLAAIRRGLASGDAEPGPAMRLSAGVLRPSIETTLHALLPHPVVVHVHSVNAIAFAVRRDGPALVAERLAGLRHAWVPYARPGLPLTRAVQAVMHSAPDILLLGNHGLVVGAADTAAAAALLDAVEARLALPERTAPPADAARLASIAAASAGRYRPAALAEAHWAATDPISFGLAGRGALYPDHVVFLGASPVPCLDRAATTLPPDAALLLVEGAGALVRAELGAGGEEMAACLGLVLARLDAAAPIAVLTGPEEAELLGWDAEHYRQSLNAAAS